MFCIMPFLAHLSFLANFEVKVFKIYFSDTTLQYSIKVDIVFPEGKTVTFHKGKRFLPGEPFRLSRASRFMFKGVE